MPSRRLFSSFAKLFIFAGGAVHVSDTIAKGEGSS